MAMASCASSSQPVVLILRHSFVKRLYRDLLRGFDARASPSFGLEKDAIIHVFGVGGRTVPKLVQFDLSVVSSLQPDVVILEIGTNDLSFSSPETVSSFIVDLVDRLCADFCVRVVGVCKVIPRAGYSPEVLNFNAKAFLLNNYLDLAFEYRSHGFSWLHRGFNCPSISPYLPDGVHVNSFGQYALYRSYRGAVLQALRML